MSYCKAKMHKIRFRLGLCPQTPLGGAPHSAPPDPLAGFKGSYFYWKGTEGMEKEWEKGEWKGEGREGEFASWLGGIDALKSRPTVISKSRRL